MFLLLQEQTIEIWKRKLDWIAEHGGMALLDVHPDYMDFHGTRLKWNQYPAALYAEFLDYVKTRHPGAYWHALPRDVADYCSRLKLQPTRMAAQSPSGRALLDLPDPAQPLVGKRVAVVVFSHYPSDPRPRRAAEALAQEGMEVDVICLMQEENEPREYSFHGVRVSPIRLKRRRGGRFTYISQYLWFILGAFSKLTWRTFTRRYDLVHIHNMPDVLVFSALVPKLLGARVILDLHDPMPELMMTIFGLREESRIVRLLKRLERASIRFADAVLTVNLACKKIFTARSCAAGKLNVVMNAPDEGIFKYRDAAPGDFAPRALAKPFVMMYHGSIVERHGLDLAVQALEQVRQTVPNAVLRIYGGHTPFLEQVMQTVAERGLQDAVQSLGSKKLNEIAAAIDECDVGVIPNRRSIFTEINTPTRIFEYLSRGKPVIAPDSGGITDYFGKDELVFFKLGDAGDLARAMLFVHSNPAQAGEIVLRGQAVYRAHRWVQERDVLFNLVNRLAADPGMAVAKRGTPSTVAS
jgi:glycosyltransferase involved in cell wall biosynthesis